MPARWPLAQNSFFGFKSREKGRELDGKVSVEVREDMKAMAEINHVTLGKLGREVPKKYQN